MADTRAHMATCQSSVLKIYQSVIEDVINSVRDDFMDAGVGEEVLQELRQVWRTKIVACKAVARTPEPEAPRPPQIVVNHPKINKIAPVKTKKSTPAATDGGPTTSSAAAAAALRRVQQSPPPLHPTSDALMLQRKQQQQRQHQTSSANRIMAVNITLPGQPGTPNPEPRVLTIYAPASLMQDNRMTQILSGQLIGSIMSLPSKMAQSVLQQHINAELNASRKPNTSRQLDGALDTSDEDESDKSVNLISDDDDDDDPDPDSAEMQLDPDAVEEEPINSDDDVTDEGDDTELFETDNIIVCQFDKVIRAKNRWRFYLKDGIMNIGGKDYVFQKCNGEAEW